MQFVLLIEYYQDDDAIYDNIKVLEASIIDNPLPTDAASCSQCKKKKKVSNCEFSHIQLFI